MNTLISSLCSGLGPPLALLLTLASCSILTDAEENGSSASRIETVESFAVYFANPWRDTLATFDLVVLDPDNRSASEIQMLRDRGARPIAYVNLGEAETYRYFYDQVDPDWLLGPNPNWPDHYYVDARAEGWRRLLLDTVIPNIMEKGFEGLFFDMVDTALPGLHPETKPGMLALTDAIRQAYPDRILIMNNGLFLVDDVQASLDALIVENVFTRYDFENDRYVRTSSSRRDELVSQLRAYRTRYDLPSLLLNYAESGGSPLRAYASSNAQEAGFPTFISTVELDTMFSSPSP